VQLKNAFYKDPSLVKIDVYVASKGTWGPIYKNSQNFPNLYVPAKFLPSSELTNFESSFIFYATEH